jgi:hypothetical protein
MNQNLINSSGAAPELQAQSGYTKCYFFEVSVTSPNITNTGTIKGTVKTHDYKSLYKAYNLDANAAPSQWIYKFNADPELNQVQTINETTVEVEMNVDLSYKITGNGSTSTVYIYYSTIILNTKNGKKKTYIVTNPDSAYATDSQGHPYSEFTAVK